MTDNKTTDDVTQAIRTAFGVAMKASDGADDNLRFRAEAAIRNIIMALHGLAEDYQLDTEIKAALFELAHGLEPDLPDDIRRAYAKLEDGPPDKIQ